MQILLVEDDQKLSELITAGLTEAGYQVTCVHDGRQGVEEASKGSFDAAIFDIMLPELDGISAIQSLRSKGVDLPVLVLSAMHEIEDRVRGLKAGGDDYLTKPFALVELVARLEALVRRARTTNLPSEIRFADLCVNLRARSVVCGDKEMDLQPKEFDLLLYLIQNSGRIISKPMIMKAVWNYNVDPQTNVVEAAMCRLREKLDRVSEKKLIHTKRGVGYVLKEAE